MPATELSHTESKNHKGPNGGVDTSVSVSSELARVRQRSLVLAAPKRCGFRRRAVRRAPSIGWHGATAGRPADRCVDLFGRPAGRPAWPEARIGGEHGSRSATAAFATRSRSRIAHIAAAATAAAC
jgi:hypothetical protein